MQPTVCEPFCLAVLYCLVSYCVCVMLLRVISLIMYCRGYAQIIIKYIINTIQHKHGRESLLLKQAETERELSDLKERYTAAVDVIGEKEELVRLCLPVCALFRSLTHECCMRVGWIHAVGRAALGL